MVRLDMGKCCELRGYHGELSRQRDTHNIGTEMLAGTELRTAPRVTATKRASVPQLARVVQRAWHNGPRATVVVEIFSWNGGGITALQQEMLITSTITQSDYSHLHKNVSYLLRDLGAEYPMYLYHHKTRFKFIFLIKQNPNRQCRLADEKIF